MKDLTDVETFFSVVLSVYISKRETDLNYLNVYVLRSNI